jgi:Family of unknown function (DUF5691)
MTSVGYEDLVAAATVGLSHRPLQATGIVGAAAEHAGVLDAHDQAAALLDAAALLVTARRAGVRPLPDVATPEPAPADPDPELPARATQLLGRVLGGDPALLADLLSTAAQRGYRAPAPLLPALLNAAVGNPMLRPAVATALGARGRWLARYRADWQRVADTAPPDPTTPAAACAAAGGDKEPTGARADEGAAGADSASAGPGSAQPDDGAASAESEDLLISIPDDYTPGAWETGGRAERRAYLAALRDHDPAAARELLASGWSAETGDDRADLIGVLTRGLSDADEAFLEAALDDRKEAVRAAARRLLARIPSSAFNRRAAERAAPLLRLERQGLRRRLVVTLPDTADAPATRDGITAKAPDLAIGPGAWLLTQMISLTPLTEWVTRLGLDPAELISLPVADGHEAEVRGGWRLAAISQGRGDWAEALLAAGAPGQARFRSPVAWPEDHELAAVLTPEARAARAAAILGRSAPTVGTVTEAANCPGPWPDVLARAVLAALTAAVGAAALAERSPIRATAGHHRSDLAARRLATDAGRLLPATDPADYAAAMTRLAHISNCPERWASALQHAADVIALRRAFQEEIR